MGGRADLKPGTVWDDSFVEVPRWNNRANRVGRRRSDAAARTAIGVIAWWIGGAAWTGGSSRRRSRDTRGLIGGAETGGRDWRGVEGLACGGRMTGRRRKRAR